MTQRRRYRKKANQFVTAVRLKLDTDGLVYRKWGGRQRGKRGDWLVDEHGEVYTVDARSFAKKYRRRRPGFYVKVAPVWAEVATREGSIRTKEGRSKYRKGDYLVFNSRNGTDGYCIRAARFKAMYRLDRERSSRR
jgi:hypothetical protein